MSYVSFDQCVGGPISIDKDRVTCYDQTGRIGKSCIIGNRSNGYYPINAYWGHDMNGANIISVEMNNGNNCYISNCGIGILY